MAESRRLTIAILTDGSSWMNCYDQELAARLASSGHHVKLINTKAELPYGDVAFFLSCFEIVKGEYLRRNIHNIVVHASNLPNGKGWSPTTWQILEGKNIIPLSLFEATEEVDAGDIYLRDSIYLDGSELIAEWQRKLGHKIVDMCCEYVERYCRGDISGFRQNGAESFYPRRKPADSKLDVNKSIAEQFNLLRVVDNENYPAFFEYAGRKYVLKVYGGDNV